MKAMRCFICTLYLLSFSQCMFSCAAFMLFQDQRHCIRVAGMPFALMAMLSATRCQQKIPQLRALFCCWVQSLSSWSMCLTLTLLLTAMHSTHFCRSNQVLGHWMSCHGNSSSHEFCNWGSDCNSAGLLSHCVPFESVLLSPERSVLMCSHPAYWIALPCMTQSSVFAPYTTGEQDQTLLSPAAGKAILL